MKRLIKKSERELTPQEYSELKEKIINIQNFIRERDLKSRFKSPNKFYSYYPELMSALDDIASKITSLNQDDIYVKNLLKAFDQSFLPKHFFETHNIAMDYVDVPIEEKTEYDERTLLKTNYSFEDIINIINDGKINSSELFSILNFAKNKKYNLESIMDLIISADFTRELLTTEILDEYFSFCNPETLGRDEKIWGTIYALLSEDAIDKNIEKINLKRLIYTKKDSIKNIFQKHMDLFLEKISMAELIGWSTKLFTEDQVMENKKYIKPREWSRILLNANFSSEFVEKILETERIDEDALFVIFERYKLSEETIQKQLNKTEILNSQNFKSLVETILNKQNVSPKFINQYMRKKIGEKIALEKIFGNINLEEVVYEKYLPKLEKYNISGLSVLFGKRKFSESFLNNNKQYWTSEIWSNISTYQKLTETFMSLNKDKINWEYICEHQDLNTDFILLHKDYVDWSIICRYQKLPISFIIGKGISYMNIRSLQLNKEINQQEMNKKRVYEILRDRESE